MTNFRNLKIAINDQQPLDGVVKELERLGYKREAWLNQQKEVIATFLNGVYSNFNYFYNDKFKPTTLAELKEM